MLALLILIVDAVNAKLLLLLPLWFVIAISCAQVWRQSGSLGILRPIPAVAPPAAAIVVHQQLRPRNARR